MSDTRNPSAAAPPGTAVHRRDTLIAAFAAGGIALHLALLALRPPLAPWPLLVVLAGGGLPLLADLGRALLGGVFGSDLLAGISILAAAALGQYLVGAIIVLMLAGGAALEAMATRRATRVLGALAARLPLVAHKPGPAGLIDIPTAEIVPGDLLIVLPHEICPVDGEVVAGHSTMDESYLTGEPFRLAKAPGAAVISGAINGEGAVTLRASAAARDSRYARIMEVMRRNEHARPHLRRLGDRLGAFYTPLAVAIAAAAGVISGDPQRFLAVIVIATPCPLLIAIPVAILGAISLAARHGIIIRDPGVLERVATCRTLILDKTGTLTHGRPTLTEFIPGPGFTAEEALAAAASLETYSRHPLAAAVIEAAHARGLAPAPAAAVSERPGEGLTGEVGGRRVAITGRGTVAAAAGTLPPLAEGLECLVLIGGRFAGLCRFHDAPREDGRPFIAHLAARHAISRVMLVSGDRAAEVRYLADAVGIADIRASQSPEEKLAIVRAETRTAPTLFVGDGINDAPALMAASVGVAFGPNSDITSEAAGAVILSPSLVTLDLFLHIGARLRRIALESAVGGMVLSLAGMALAAGGWLPPLAGAVGQEAIDLLAVLNAVRVALPTARLGDLG